MVPYMTLRMRLIAWLLWKLEGFGDHFDAEYALERPALLKCTGLLSDYCYYRRAKEWMR